jgi:hypothetical protein
MGDPDSAAPIDLEFVVTVDDILSTTRVLLHGRRPAYLVPGIFFLAVGPVLWWFGIPVAAGIVVCLGMIALLNPRVAPIDRWFLKRTPGNRIGTTWRVQIDSFGIRSSSGGYSGQHAWTTVREVRIAFGVLVFVRDDGTGILGLPLRSITPSQLDALLQLVARQAPAARIVDGRS